MKIKIKRLTETARIPTRGSDKAAGYDLYADCQKTVYIAPQETMKIGTGVALQLPDGYFAAIFARSGLASKQGLRPANCVGVCDSDYRGEYVVALYNDSNRLRKVEPGDRIAQLVALPFLPMEFEECGELGGTDRGEGGFGSTGR